MMNNPDNTGNRRSSNFLKSKVEIDDAIDPGSDYEEESYFKNDNNTDIEHPQKSSKKSKNKISTLYDSNFRFSTFMRYFSSHVIFFFLLGPLMFILTPFYGYQDLRNQGFVGFKRGFFIQTFQYFLVVSFIVLQYIDTNPDLHFMEIYSMIFAVLVRIIIIAMKYAFATDSYLHAMRTREMKWDELDLETLLGPWADQTEEIMHLELQSSILRLEIESSLFFFEFIYKDSELETSFLKSHSFGGIQIKSLITEDTKNSQRNEFPAEQKASLLEIAPNQHRFSLQIETKELEKLNRDDRSISWRRKLFQPRKRAVSVQQGKNGVEVPEPLKKVVENFSSFLAKKNLEEKKLYGYNLVYDIARKAKISRMKYLPLICVVLSSTRAIIPILYRVYQGKSPLTDKPYLVIIPLIINLLFFWFNLNIISLSILDLCSRHFSLKQISSLISPKRKLGTCDKKYYPTINIFDPVSLKTWENTRRIVLEYGRKFIMRNSANVTVIMLLYLIIIMIIILTALNILQTYTDPLLQILLGYECLIFLVIFLEIFVLGSKINDQYRVNKNLLKKAKIIISDFLRLSNYYVGKNAIIPDNRIYREGMLILKTELGEKHFESKLKDRCENLIAIIDDIMEDLDFEYENEPFTVIGIPPSYSLLKTILFGIGSIIFAVVQKNFGV